jgi:hypothetical protein
MKERLVRGTNVASVVRMLRVHRRKTPLPELGQWEQDLLRKRVAPSTWYSIRVFDSLLQMVHRYVFDGSELAAQNMGRSQARERMKSAPEVVIVTSDALETLRLFAARWRDQYNFGEVAISALPAPVHGHSARVRITGFPDMSACLGHAIIGFTLELLERSGARDAESEIEERPWMHNNVLSYVLRWN